MPSSVPPTPSNGLPGSPGRVDALTTACRPFIDPSRPKFWKDDAAIRAAMDLQATFEERSGFCWAFGRPLSTGFTTILPPNSEACMQKEAPGRGAVSASSQHQGGVHILLLDGSVNFISDSIDTGDLSVQPVKWNRTGKSAPGAPSPYGIWGAMGTRANGEVVTESFQ